MGGLSSHVSVEMGFFDMFPNIWVPFLVHMGPSNEINKRSVGECGGVN